MLELFYHLECHIFKDADLFFKDLKHSFTKSVLVLEYCKSKDNNDIEFVHSYFYSNFNRAMIDIWSDKKFSVWNDKNKIWS